MHPRSPGAGEVTGPLLVSLGVPFGALDGVEIASVDVQSHGEVAPGVGDGMDHVVAEDQDVAGRQLSAADRLEASWNATVEGVVLLAAVHSDDCPHPVLVGIEGHAGRPCHVEDREVDGVVERGDAAGLDRSERPLEASFVSDELVEDVAHGHRRRVLA